MYPSQPQWGYQSWRQGPRSLREHICISASVSNICCCLRYVLFPLGSPGKHHAAGAYAALRSRSPRPVIPVSNPQRARPDRTVSLVMFYLDILHHDAGPRTYRGLAGGSRITTQDQAGRCRYLAGVNWGMGTYALSKHSSGRGET